MHKVFGMKEDKEYFDRKGAYILPFNGDKVAVTKARKGYYLLGGGINPGETDEECILRECLEETGYAARVEAFVCSGETYCWVDSIGDYHPMQKYYLGQLLEKKQEPVETDHFMEWVKVEDLKGKMVIEMQSWALEEAYKMYRNRI